MVHNCTCTNYSHTIPSTVVPESVGQMEKTIQKLQRMNTTTNKDIAAALLSLGNTETPPPIDGRVDVNNEELRKAINDVEGFKEHLVQYGLRDI